MSEVTIVDVSNILRPEQLPFSVPRDLEIAINELIDALACDHEWLDAYLDEVAGSARGVDEEKDAWVRAYYVNFGWRRDGLVCRL